MPKDQVQYSISKVERSVCLSTTEWKDCHFDNAFAGSIPSDMADPVAARHPPPKARYCVRGAVPQTSRHSTNSQTKTCDFTVPHEYLSHISSVDVVR